MKKFKGAMDIAAVVGAVLVVVILGSLMYTLTDMSTVNASKNASGAVVIFTALLPLLVIITVIVSFVHFAER